MPILFKLTLFPMTALPLDHSKVRIILNQQFKQKGSQIIISNCLCFRQYLIFKTRPLFFIYFFSAIESYNFMDVPELTQTQHQRRAADLIFISIPAYRPNKDRIILNWRLKQKAKKE